MAENPPPKPKTVSADQTSSDIRDRILDSVAAAVHQLQRIGDIADRVGLPTTVPPTLGEDIYSLTVAHLDVATRVLSHSQTLADKLLDAADRRLTREGKLKSKGLASGGVGEQVFRFVVQSGAHEGDVACTVGGNATAFISARAVRPRLGIHEQTSVLVRVSQKLDPDSTYYGDICVSVGGSEVAKQPFEAFVEK